MMCYVMPYPWPSEARGLFSEAAAAWWRAVQQRSAERWSAASLSTLIPSRILHIAMAGGLRKGKGRSGD